MQHKIIVKAIGFFLNPFILFWMYYFIGPFLTIDLIQNIKIGQGMFEEDALISLLLRHTISYISLLPLVIFCANLNLSGSGKTYRIKPKILTVIPIMIFFTIVLFFVYSAIDFSKLFFLPDSEKASRYMLWWEKNRVMPLMIFGLMMGKLFIGAKHYLFLGIPSVIIDVLCSRRHLLLLFIYPLVLRLKAKGVFIFVIIIGIFTSMRHGPENIVTNMSALVDAVFSESYMVFLSSTDHFRCSFNVNTIFDIYHFERLTSYCINMYSHAGGFSLRFQYDVLFGVLSGIIYSLMFFIFLKVFSHSILPIFRDILGIVIFVSFFIAYRDGLGNSLSYMFQYVLILFFTSHGLRWFFRSPKKYRSTVVQK
jgi:hypothetical protein